MKRGPPLVASLSVVESLVRDVVGLAYLARRRLQDGPPLLRSACGGRVQLLSNA